MATRLRVFISSPGDVRDAREVAARTVEKVAPDYLRHFEVEPYMWETEALVASGHFQDAIEPPSQFDVVALILWSRLGTLLPEKTAVRSYAGIDGRSPVTGTEWEYEDALRAAREHGAPDLLVYRSRRPAQIDAMNAEKRGDELSQLAALDHFWSRHFADRGAFIGAYHEFAELEDLAAAFEAHLRQLLDRRVAETVAEKTDAARARVWAKAPFRGLEAFDYDHAQIFFGREEATGKALGQLIDNAASGPAFLLVLGASGSGKSSLAHAGLAPRLALPRRVVGKCFLRRVVFRPGDRREGEDVFDALARAFVTRGEKGIGLPEAGDAARLAGVLRNGPQHAPAFIAQALDSLTGRARASGRMLHHEEPALLLLLDQLEELFTDQRITIEQRRQFVTLVRALAAERRVWVLATMRADLWHRAAETPELVEIAAGSGRFDLLPPRPAEISQMIRLPAEAAGLSFERSDADGVPLNDRIAEEAADAPGVLPLLSYLLEQLYQADAIDAGGSVLTYASYQALGGLRGAIAARADSILAAQPVEVRAALRRVLFSLVQVNADAGGATTVTARRSPLLGFDASGPARALVDAFLDPKARLLVVDSDSGGSASVRVAHEALLTQWARARDCIAEDAVLLRIRRTTEQRYARWLEVKAQGVRTWWPAFSAEHCLLANADLSDALRLLEQHRDDLPAGLPQYMERSAAHERRRRRTLVVVLASVAGVMTGLAGAAGYYQLRAVDLAHENMKFIQDRADEAIGQNKLDLGERYWRFIVGQAEQANAIQPINFSWCYDRAIGLHWLGYISLARGGRDGARQAMNDLQSAERTAARCKYFALSKGQRSDLDDLNKEISIYQSVAQRRMAR
jgi:hypothetical protein